MAATPTDIYRGQQGMAPVTQSYDPTVVGWIVQASHATGADPAALLATSLQESGARRGAVGDNGSSYGPFQFHRGGALAGHTPAWANSYDAVLNRATEFSRGGVHHGKGAAAVQRPLDQSLYARGVDNYLQQAHAILAHFHGQAPKATSSAPAAADTSVDDTADEGPLMLDALRTLHQSGLQAGLPGAAGRFTGDPRQDVLNSIASTAGIPAATIVPPRLSPVDVPSVKLPKAKASAPAMPSTPLGTPGGGWGGSHALAQRFARLGQSFGLSIASEKRARKMTASGGVSDHWVGSKTAYAYDMSNGSSPTPQMDRFATTVAAQLGVKNWHGGVLNVNQGGYRYQVLYRTNVGGNHFNHVHVGVRKL